MWYHLPHLSGIISSSNIIMQDRTMSEFCPSRYVQMDEDGIASMQWPARSQDLNPIENVWDMMRRRVWALQPPPATLGELGEQIIAIWDNQDQADVLSTINSMV
ncbi:hypothetical protein MTP99_003711 [Tenebrio molitor]|nr:hypothetical protein MTP99_003711 [Tenebrio molitor]